MCGERERNEIKRTIQFLSRNLGKYKESRIFGFKNKAVFHSEHLQMVNDSESKELF